MTHKLQYITRFAYPGIGRPHWWVRFTRLGNIVVSERFYDNELGGREKPCPQPRRSGIAWRSPGNRCWSRVG
jgi:hypothetical protein